MLTIHISSLLQALGPLVLLLGVSAVAAMGFKHLRASQPRKARIRVETRRSRPRN